MDMPLDGPHDQAEFERLRATWLAAACRQQASDPTLWAADRILEHKPELFQHLQQRWKDLFDAQLDVLL